MAVEVLKGKGVPEERILFINLIASPSGIAEFSKKFPKLRVVTAFIDGGLDENMLVSSRTAPHACFADVAEIGILFRASGTLVTGTTPCSLTTSMYEAFSMHEICGWPLVL